MGSISIPLAVAVGEGAADVGVAAGAVDAGLVGGAIGADGAIGAGIGVGGLGDVAGEGALIGSGLTSAADLAAAVPEAVGGVAGGGGALGADAAAALPAGGALPTGAAGAPASISAAGVAGPSGVAGTAPVDLTSAASAASTGAGDTSVTGIPGAAGSEGGTIGGGTGGSLGGGTSSNLSADATLASDTSGVGGGTGGVNITSSGSPGFSSAAPGGGSGGVSVTSTGPQDFANSSFSGAGSSSTGGTDAPGFLDKAADWASNLPDKALASAGNNPLGVATAVGGLGYNMLQKPASAANTSAITGQAGALGTQAGQLMGYINSGTLPPGAQAALDQAMKSAKANLVSQYASRGIDVSQNPDGSYKNSTLQQDVNNLALQGQAQAFTLAENLLKTGIDEAGLSSKLYEQLVNIDTQQSQATGTAISNLAAALSPSRTVTVKAA